MSNVVIWIKSSQKETFSSCYHKGASYLQLLERLREKHRVFLAYDLESYRGDDVFSPVSEFRGEGERAIRADAIYNLGNIPGEDFAPVNARISNTPAFRKFFASKFAAYDLLEEFFPKTFFIAHPDDLPAALAKIRGELAVFKPNTGTNGTDVRIFKKSAATPDDGMTSAIMNGGALLQEFVDTRRGIPGICDSYHDLRLATVNDVIALTHVRIPEPGSLVANYAQGATIRELSVNDIPENVLAFYEKVHERITGRFPKPMYTMDIGVDASGNPLLFEINGTTAFPWPEFESRDYFIENLAEHLGGR